MEWSLKDKVVVITGGCKGIGYEIAQNFLKHGAKVTLLLDINECEGAVAVKNLQEAHGGGKAEFIKCDVTKDLDSVPDKIINKYKTVDVLVNNAGILNDAEWKKCMDVNSTYLVGWSLKFWDHMRKDLGGKGGTIINLSSIYGYRVYQHLPIYMASKYAVQGFTRSLGHLNNYNKSGVRVLAINPGFTETELTVSYKLYDDRFFKKDFEKYLEEMPWQKVDVVGAAAVEVFEKGLSGTSWLIEGGNPVTEI